MQIEIDKTEDSSITEPINIELGDYTIFAGENNSGKTNLIRAIKDHKDLKTYKPIFVPAEHIQPQNEEAKSSATTTEFSKLIKILVGPIFNKNLLKNLIEKFNKSEEKKKFIGDVNKILGDFGVEKKEFDVKISEDKFNEDTIIKITKALVKDLYETDVDDVDFENIGMGAQRLIVAALIQYYAMSKIKDPEKKLIIFEEPEAYLHPKWKKSLHKALLNLSKEKNIMVLITTHDPYFIELGKEQKIYRVYRNSEKKDATDIEEMTSKVLPYRSHSEINYQIFGISSKVYFLEIYEYLKAKTGNEDKTYQEFDDKILGKKVKQTCLTDNKKNHITPLTRLRHDIAHHPKTKIGLEKATKDIINILKK